MKGKSIFIFFLFSILNFQFVMNNSPILAQSITPLRKSASVSATTASPTPDGAIEKLKQIEQLKEKIATKVAELREKDKRAVAGNVKKITGTSFLIADRKGNEYTISYSDDTTFYAVTVGEKKETSAKKIKEDDTIVVFGYTATDKTTLSAKYVYQETPLKRIIGKIVDIDKTNFTITVKDKEGNQAVDIESFTKMTVYTKSKGKQKGGFSKFKIGDIIHVAGRVDKKDTEKLSASFIITLPNPSQGATPAVSPSITTPASPSATPEK